MTQTLPLTRYRRAQARINELLEPGANDSILDKIINTVLILLIIANVLAMILDTVPSYHARYGAQFGRFEHLSLWIFTVEYALRLWSAPACSPLSAGRARWAYIWTPFALIDLAAILPLLAPVFGADLRVLRLLRVFRALRLFKLVRYSQALQLIGHVIRQKREELTITLVMAAMLLLVLSTLVFNCEHPTRPEVFSDLPTTLWWGVVTLTSVGYGDIFPTTVWGRVFGGIIAFGGIPLFALPAGVLGSAFIDEVKKRRECAPSCPHCGQPL